MAEHDRGGATQTKPMRGTHYCLPFCCINLVRADDSAHLIIQNLCCRAGQSAKPGIAQTGKKIGQRKPERARALMDFQRGEGMDMHPRHGLLDGAANRFIGCAGILRVDAALQADFGGTTRPGFLGATGDFCMVKIIGRAAQGFMSLALAEGAEAATIGADIRIIDVPIDDIAHGIARNCLPQPIGGRHDMRLIRIPCREQRLNRRRIEPFALRGAFHQG